MPDRLLQGWAGFGPGAAQSKSSNCSAGVMIGSPPRCPRPSAGTLPPAEIDAARRQQWLASRDEGLRARAAKSVRHDE